MLRQELFCPVLLLFICSHAIEKGIERTSCSSTNTMGAVSITKSDDIVVVDRVLGYGYRWISILGPGDC